MPEEQRATIKKIVDHFRGKPINQNVLTEYCNLNKFEPLTVGEYKDYLYQVEHDEKVMALYPLILAEIQKLRYTPEFATEKERKAVKEGNDEVRVNITKLFEQHAILYRTVDTLGQELGAIIGGTVASAGQTAFNKALEVLMHLARERFGGEFNMKHAADYAIEVFSKKEKEDKAVVTETTEPVATPVAIVKEK